MSQTVNGKAFEYCLLIEINELLKDKVVTKVIEDKNYHEAKSCYERIDDNEKHKFNDAAKAGIKHIMLLEPNLNDSSNINDPLILKLQSDKEGIIGDVRDVLTIKHKQKWEIGISAKNNHKAVKHSRLSDKLDFGDKWLGINCSKSYFNEIKPIFDMLRKYKASNELWRNLENKDNIVYKPILDAFIKEIKLINKENPKIVASKLLEYLIGTSDFYKVIKHKDTTEIQGYNLHGTLNQRSKTKKPILRLLQLKLPEKIIEIEYKEGSLNTIIITFDKGWVISFRIHNASSKIEPSLKFDIQLIGNPATLYTTHVMWE